jgi:hypothetical protein
MCLELLRLGFLWQASVPWLGRCQRPDFAQILAVGAKQTIAVVLPPKHPAQSAQVPASPTLTTIYGGFQSGVAETLTVINL